MAINRLTAYFLVGLEPTTIKKEAEQSNTV